MQSTIMHEEWRPIFGYESYYEVSNLGRVRALARTVLCRNQVCSFLRTYPAKLLPAHALEHGYMQVTLNKHGKSKAFLVHRLVAQAFLPNPDNKPEVNHKDRNGSNNAVSNLEWVTKLENMQHALATGWAPQLSRKGRSNTSEHRQKISKSLRAISRPWYYKCRCKETGEIFLSAGAAL